MPKCSITPPRGSLLMGRRSWPIESVSVELHACAGPLVATHSLRGAAWRGWRTRQMKEREPMMLRFVVAASQDWVEQTCLTASLHIFVLSAISFTYHSIGESDRIDKTSKPRAAYYCIGSRTKPPRTPPLTPGYPLHAKRRGMAVGSRPNAHAHPPRSLPQRIPSSGRRTSQRAARDLL